MRRSLVVFRFIRQKTFSKKGCLGQMTLPFVLLIGGLIVEIAVAGSFVTYFLSTSGFGGRLSERASAVSQAGIYDAIVKITKNKEFTNTSCLSPYSYSFVVESDTTNITVCRSEDISANRYTYTITSLATAGSRQKKNTATVLVDLTSGRVNLESIKETSIE